MTQEYRVVARAAQAEILERKSRFLATVRRVEEEAEAREVIEDCRRSARDARHHCSAFVLGARGEITRSSDDGEPAGTAGMPMLETIKGVDLSDVVVVVTRWFGGIKLGTGGLVRAYSAAAGAGLDAAGVARRVQVQHAEMRLPMDRVGKVENDLRSRPESLALGVAVESVDYGAEAVLRLSAPVARWEDVMSLAAEWGMEPQATGRAWSDRT